MALKKELMGILYAHLLMADMGIMNQEKPKKYQNGLYPNARQEYTPDKLSKKAKAKARNKIM